MARRVDEHNESVLAMSATMSTSAMTALMSLVRYWTSEDFQVTLAANAGVDIEARDVPALFLLGLNGPMQPSKLGQSLRVSAGNISKIAGRLVDSDYAARIPVTRDARASLIALTPAGAEACTALYKEGERLLARLLVAESPLEIDIFTRVLTRLAERAGAD